MGKPLYEACGACEGSGEFRGGVTARFEPEDLGRVAALAERGVCPFCEGRRYLPIGLTDVQVESMNCLLDELTKLLGTRRRSEVPDLVRALQRRLARAEAELRDPR